MKKNNLPNFLATFLVVLTFAACQKDLATAGDTAIQAIDTADLTRHLKTLASEFKAAREASMPEK